MTRDELVALTGDNESRIELRPGESRADFIARVIAASGKPSAEQLADLRRLLPPVPAEHRKAA